MVILYNILPIIIVLASVLGGYLAFKKYGVKGAILSAIAAFLLLALYTNIQPSYLPKGTVPALSRVPIEQPKVRDIENRLKEPMSEEQRQQRVDEIITVRDEIKHILADEKTTNSLDN